MNLKSVLKNILVEGDYPKSFDNLPRPARMEKPKAEKGLGRRKWRDFYIGDQLEHIFVDKYGKERGEKTFDYFVNQPNKAIYTVCSEIMDEKAKMLIDLGEEIPRNYFEINYFNLWKTWVLNKGKKPIYK